MENKIEIWKTIDGYPNYMVSNLGRVRSLGRTKTFVSKTKEGKEYTLTKKYKGKIMKQSISVFGYNRVSLTKDVEQKTFSVHRLVASAFLPNPKNYPVVNHKDENKQNNCVENLEWCTQQYNINYGTGNKRRIDTRNKNKSYHYTREVGQYTLNNVLIKKYLSANDTGYCREAIRDCCLGKQKTAYGYKWHYLN